MRRKVSPDSGVPRTARRVTLYHELETYLRQFAEGIYQFLWVTGRPGTGKTEGVSDAIRGRPACYVKSGQLTPLALYI
jgi:hypothetical protein